LIQREGEGERARTLPLFLAEFIWDEEVERMALPIGRRKKPGSCLPSGECRPFIV
jgi:hypothetical protein